MKKLLSILAAVGLTATASAGVVACGSSEKADAKTINVEVKKDGDNFTISSKDAVKIDLAKKAEAEIKKGASVPDDAFGPTVFADKDGKKFKMADGAKVVASVTADADIKVGDTTASVKFSLTINSAQAKALGLLKEDGKSAGKDLLVKFGTKDKDGNLAKELFEFNVKASDFAETPAPAAVPAFTKDGASIDAKLTVITIKGENLPTTVDTAKLTVKNGDKALAFTKAAPTSTATELTITLDAPVEQTEAEQTITITYTVDKTVLTATVKVPAKAATK